MGIIVKNISVKVYDSISMVKYYYGPLRQVYSIITNKIPGIKLNLALPMFFKAINNSIDPNRLGFTLLVFDINTRMTK